MEIRQRVREVTAQDGWALIKVIQVPDMPGIVAQIFGRMAAEGLSVDLILQNASVERTTDVSFTVRSGDAKPSLKAMNDIKADIGAREVQLINNLAMVQVIGTGILSDPSYMGKLFGVLAEAGVNVLAIGTSEIRITILVQAADMNQAQKALHKAFQVDVAATR